MTVLERHRLTWGSIDQDVDCERLGQKLVPASRFAIEVPTEFFDADPLKAATLAMGMLLVILPGHIDLSAGSGVGLIGGIAAVLPFAITKALRATSCSPPTTTVCRSTSDPTPRISFGG